MDAAAWVRRGIVIGGREWLVETVEDEDALLAASEGRAQFPFGLMLWESAPALSAELQECPEWVAGRSVLELGCGIGLTGVVAASLGGRVVATDHDETALSAARRTAELNGVAGHETALGDWADWRVPGSFEVILGADVVYDAEDHGPLLGVLSQALAPRGVVMLADPGRTAVSTFLAQAEAVGWVIRRSVRRVAEIKPSTAGGREIEVSILTLRHDRDR